MAALAAHNSVNRMGSDVVGALCLCTYNYVMGEERGARWLGRHAIVAPFGIFAATVLLVNLSGQWDGLGSLNHAASLVDLGVVVYAMVAVLVERGVNMIFWALEQRRKRREKLQAEALAQGRAEEKGAGLAGGQRKGYRRRRVVPGRGGKGIVFWALEQRRKRRGPESSGVVL